MTMRRQTAESFVFVSEELLKLRHLPNKSDSVQVSSHADALHPDRVLYEEGVDYIVDYENGLIGRTAESRIPDWSKHVLCGIQDFNHTLFEDYSNRNYTVYAGYSYDSGQETGHAEQKSSGSQADILKRIASKLQAGEEVLYAVYGDSISTGGEASEDKFTYFHRFADHLKRLYPKGSIRIVNKAIGGEASDGGAGRVEEDLLPLNPDLVTIGYGMNDQNKFEHGNGVPLADFDQNLRRMIEVLRDQAGSDIVLVTPCAPNPLWRHTSGQTGEYAAVIRQLGIEYGLGVADVTAVWERELAAGKTPESLLLNNINHPNDYGHYLYYLAFADMLGHPAAEQ
ncbi:SGNH/GDSL hydrolase family protein [Paenibacillus mendelii]|uniref:SGNH/GDSL hydrolase family protein n=1 Tax=Paenibacillus mendelii TaxID=206163 RepID=A0ABV6J6S9_9BACL|nr:SGNH/GDSL hydrolase family protein [Paenibacillus mendelii]MCQ6561049.1 SGNH/GDSL hydrolase family protein [Paenibacillus mendelii]